ncbi:hypothetical protein VTN00DRAFT_2385 [Thermoascus crustaceus]|uniref:uncharacterized protein n=1 Tax=Thermoascus crustaceus TaxID=5088 RepID=UPI003743A26C
MNVVSRESNQLFKKINNYSPIMERLDLPLYNYTMDGCIFDVSHSAFRAEPEPESDAAWERVSKLGPMVMSGEEVRKIGKNPEDVVKAPWNGVRYGDDAYIWQFEMQHNIHCLSFIRQYAEVGPRPPVPLPTLPPARSALPAILQSHYPVVFHWIDGWRAPHADFNVNNQCINHEAALQWQIENKVDPKGKVIEKPPTAKILHGPRKAKAGIVNKVWQQPSLSGLVDFQLVAVIYWKTNRHSSHTFIKRHQRN